MARTQRERAFLRDLYISDEWTKRFTDLVDQNIKFEDVDNLLYLNAGTGSHCFQLRERLDDKIAIFARCENEHLAAIAKDKALAIKADVDFSTLRFDDDSFDLVVADATLLAPKEIEDFVSDSVRVAKIGGRVAIFLPSAGSYGEIFSLLWEVLYNEDLGDHGHAAEDMITELPSIERIEGIASRAGLVDIKTHSAREVFEFKNGSDFIASPLVSDFLLPEWLKTLNEAENSRVSAKLAELIDSEDGDMSFRFSIKATLLTGRMP
ncbi:MAG TPA: class I SAM-dependent methyltransferase [Pyrinomonadaceae bacterium]|nr:class I SAM-dependent methyltransferase [Pyrinomonadaceae bacterium]